LLRSSSRSKSCRAVAPELVGQKPVSIVLGKNSGPPSMAGWCEKLGVTATDEERMAILQLVKAKSFEKREPQTPDEFKAIRRAITQMATVAEGARLSPRPIRAPPWLTIFRVLSPLRRS
jgi:hypothetical protein